tara:strand:+ start:959 stop:1150 length:192 start_codon:yes stop_codon:yes gene_type:complete
MGKEFYSDAIKLMKSFGRGNQSSRKIVGGDGRSGRGRMRGVAASSRSRAPGRGLGGGGRGGRP